MLAAFGRKLFLFGATTAVAGLIVKATENAVLPELAHLLKLRGFGIYYVFGGPWIGQAIQDIGSIAALAGGCLRGLASAKNWIVRHFARMPSGEG